MAAFQTPALMAPSACTSRAGRGGRGKRPPQFFPLPTLPWRFTFPERLEGAHGLDHRSSRAPCWRPSRCPGVQPVPPGNGLRLGVMELSFRFTEGAWQIRLSPSEKLVLLVLSHHADDSGRCWPSMVRICAMTGLARSTVKGAVRALIGYGLLRREAGAGRGHTSVYTLKGSIAGPFSRKGSATAIKGPDYYTKKGQPPAPEPKENIQELTIRARARENQPQPKIWCNVCGSLYARCKCQ